MRLERAGGTDRAVGIGKAGAHFVGPGGAGEPTDVPSSKVSLTVLSSRTLPCIVGETADTAARDA